MDLRPHDLLRLSSPDAGDAEGAPEWVRRSLEAAPWVVVRRADVRKGLVAIGIRGSNRAERHAAFVAPDGVVESVSPEDLSDRDLPRTHPVFAALGAMRARLDALGLAWGPAGGAGFELATGRPVLTETSDLDLIVRLGVPDPSPRQGGGWPRRSRGRVGPSRDSSAILNRTSPDPVEAGPPSPVPGEGSRRFDRRTALETLLALVGTAAVRVDVLVETPAGAVALGELFAPGADILLRTPHGPRLTAKASLFAGLAA